MKKSKTKSNKILELIKRSITYIVAYLLIEMVLLKILLYIIDNCITTLK